MNELCPVLLGADLNCLHLARSFYECYGVRALAFGRRTLSQTKGSPFLSFRAISDLENRAVLLQALRELVLHTPERVRILLGCTDAYVHLIASLRKELEADFILPYDDEKKLRRFDDKISFAALCARYGIDTPTTVCREPYAPLPDLPFAYPVIVKPAQSDRFWARPFSGMQKVYFCENATEVQAILSRFDRAGYDAPTLLQEYIRGTDADSYVLHGYSDRAGRVRALALGRVLCEEHTPRGRGNPAAILTVPCDAFCEKIKSLLEKEHYVGFFNLDIKCDADTGQRYVLECNPRQGRCAFFADVAGVPLAKSVVEERVLSLPYRGCVYAVGGYYWRYLPDGVVRRQVDASLFAQCKQAIREGHARHSYEGARQAREPWRRRLWIFLHQMRFFGKYRQNRSLQELAARAAERT